MSMRHLRSDAQASTTRWEQPLSRWFSTPALITALALGYYLLAVVADNLTLPGAVTAIWPASGLAIAAVIAFGFRIWPGIVLGIYLNQVTWTVRDFGNSYSLLPWQDFIHQSLVGLSYAAGNCLEALVIAYLVRRYAGRGNPLSSSSDVIRFIALAALLGPVIGSLSGTLVTCGIWGWTPWSAFWPTFLTWWVSVAAGVLIVAPPLLYLYYSPPVRLSLSYLRLLELALLIGVASLIVAVTFYSPYRFEYLLLPALLWAAFRFNQSITSWLAGALMMVAIVATTQGHGPFAQTATSSLSAAESLTFLQCFIVTLTSTAILVASIVTDRRRASDALLESNKTLEERVVSRTCEINQRAEEARKANEAKSRFLAAASHDLRQPLYTLRLLVETMLSRLDEEIVAEANSDRQRNVHQPDPRGDLKSDHVTAVSLREISQKMYGGIEHMGEMFGGILDISRLDARAVEARHTSVALDELIGSVQQEFSTVAQSRGLGLYYSCPKVNASTDPVLVERILRNLLDNALKYTNEGSVTIIAERVDSGIQLSVEDTGVGIPEVRQRAVFEEFFQLEDEHESVQRGLGLGLSIVKQLCQLLGHELSLQSSPGKGTKVTLVLEEALQSPLPNGAGENRSTDRSALVEHSSSKLPKSPTRVLLVDNAESFSEFTWSLLDQWGYAVQFLSIEQWQQGLVPSYRPPDVLIINVSLLTHVKKILTFYLGADSVSKSIPVIVVGFLPEHEDASNGVLSEKAAAEPVPELADLLYVSEPVKPAQLRSALRASLRSTKTQHETEHSC